MSKATPPIAQCGICLKIPRIQKIVWEEGRIELSIQHDFPGCQLRVRMPPKNRTYMTLRTLVIRWNKLQETIEEWGENNV